VEGATGAFFRSFDAASLADAIRAFDTQRFDPRVLRAHAEAFRPERFIARLRAIVEETRAR
jgi:hypothetical protein